MWYLTLKTNRHWHRCGSNQREASGCSLLPTNGREISSGAWHVRRSSHRLHPGASYDSSRPPFIWLHLRLWVLWLHSSLLHHQPRFPRTPLGFSVLIIRQTKPISLYFLISILGYCLLPIVVLSVPTIFLPMQNIPGAIFAFLSVGWCCMACSNLIESVIFAHIWGYFGFSG